METGVAQTHTEGPGVKVWPRYTQNGDIAYVALFGDKQGLRFMSGKNAAAIEPRYPSWSPDGKTMLYHKNLKADIRVVPAFGLDPDFELFSTKGWMLSYSPDGEQLALTDGSDKGPLTIMNSDGTIPAWARTTNLTGF